MKERRQSSQVFRPTPHEIREACERIQETWSERERYKRAGRAKGQHWTPPLVSSDWFTTDTGGYEDAALG